MTNVSTYGNDPQDPYGNPPGPVPPPGGPVPPPGGEVPPPAYGQPTYGQPSYGQPSYGEPNYGQPAPPGDYGGFGGGDFGGGGGGGGGGSHSGPYSAPTAIGYGWKKFTENALVFLVLTFVMFAVSITVVLVGTALTGGFATVTETSTDVTSVSELTGGFSVSSILVNIVTSLATVIFWAAMVKASIEVVSGRKATIGGAFSGIDWIQVLLASLIISALTTIGSLLCFVPGILVSFLTMFTLFFVIDKKRSAIDGLKGSFTLVTQNVGAVILFALLSFLVAMLGFVACCVGLLVAVPVITLAEAYTYRRLQGEPVAA